MDKKFFEKYIEVFLHQNSMVNLVSKNDSKLLWEKHICDSLSIEKFINKYMPEYIGKNLLDIGTGGGFPAVPTAIYYPQIEIYALDSIRKKINAIENIKSELDIKNLHTICDRVENLTDKYDIITSRAVAPLKTLVGYAAPLLNGYLVAYKSQKVNEEIKEAKQILDKNKLKVIDIIEYNLPLTENHERNLVVIGKKK